MPLNYLPGLKNHTGRVKGLEDQTTLRNCGTGQWIVGAIPVFRD